jgi:transposase
VSGKYSPELKAEAVRVVLGSDRTIASVASEFGVGAESLRTWVNKERAARRGPGGSVESEGGESDRARMARLEKENRELRMKVEFLGKATAFFAKEYR